MTDSGAVDTDTRFVSHSELRALNTCMARWDFAYDSQLAGFRLKPLRLPPLLSDGRAFGEAVAEYHKTGSDEAARSVLINHLDKAAKKQIKLGPLGNFDADEFQEKAVELLRILNNHMRLVKPMMITDLEKRYSYPIMPGYALHGNIDGLVVDRDGLTWIVDFKLRSGLSITSEVQRDRQFLRYAWLYWKVTGKKIAGVKVDETLKDAPKPVKFNKDGAISKVQTCTVSDYIAVCEERGITPDPEMVERLNKKVWHYRHTVFYSKTDYETCESELISGARQIALLRDRILYPMRNAIRGNCQKCLFVAACDYPKDREIIEQTYKIMEPKKLGAAFEADIATTMDELEATDLASEPSPA